MRSQDFEKYDYRRLSAVINDAALDDEILASSAGLPIYRELDEQDLDAQVSLSGGGQVIASPSPLALSGKALLEPREEVREETSTPTGPPPAYRPVNIGNEASQPLPPPPEATLGFYALGCTLIPNREAVWEVKDRHIRLSTLAATVLMKEGLLSLRDLELLYHKEHDAENDPQDPISAIALTTYNTVGGVVMGVAGGPLEAYREIKSQAEAEMIQSNSHINHSGTQPSMESSTVATRSPTKSSQNSYEKVAIATGNGIGQIIGTGLKAPLEVTHNLSRGFHNAPKLYGDTTVREHEKITGFQSGLAAAGKGLGYGIFDGVTGIFTQPIKGAHKEGAMGFIKGFGKGIGGAVCKPAAGACGVAGSTFMGVYKEIKKVTRPNVPAYVVTARISQGEEEYHFLDESQRHDIMNNWKAIKLS